MTPASLDHAVTYRLRHEPRRFLRRDYFLLRKDFAHVLKLLVLPKLLFRVA